MKSESAQTSPAGSFELHRYILMRNFLPAELQKVMLRYALMKVQIGQVSREDKQVPGTPSLYGDTLMETLMELACPQVELLTGKRLFPTYSYFRVYRNGDELRPHIDRPSCEISFTICLGYDTSNIVDKNYQWPFYVNNSKDYRHFTNESLAPVTPGEGFPVLLGPGDCVIYRGCEVRHWREPFPGNYQAQAFIHYVDQDGPYAAYKFDTRPMLGAPASTIRDAGPYKFFPDAQ
jgi:hypothetical protein